jgi:cytochrome c-type biogenesis protein CcmH/NrfG
MEIADSIEEALRQGSPDLEEIIRRLDVLIAEQPQDDRLYYLRGNAYRKRGDWQTALNNYLEAIELNPDSPAVHARQMAMDILNFYNKDMFNQ